MTMKVTLPVLPGVTHCIRCHKKLTYWILFPVCDMCLEWEIAYMESHGNKSTHWMDPE